MVKYQKTNLIDRKLTNWNSELRLQADRTYTFFIHMPHTVLFNFSKRKNCLSARFRNSNSVVSYWRPVNSLVLDEAFR